MLTIERRIRDMCKHAVTERLDDAAMGISGNGWVDYYYREGRNSIALHEAAKDLVWAEMSDLFRRRSPV